MFGETIANPALSVLDIEKVCRMRLTAHGVPLDRGQYLCHAGTIAAPIEFGADIVTHSTTKYMDGHGAGVGGCHRGFRTNLTGLAYAGQVPGAVCTPDESYHGITYAEKFGLAGAFITKATAQLMRDFGSIQSPQHAFLLNLGLESLHVRMKRHCGKWPRLWPSSCSGHERGGVGQVLQAWWATDDHALAEKVSA